MCIVMEQYKGTIELVTGPMFSGKSSYIINKIERYMIAKKSCIALKWKGDIRYTIEPFITTHSGLKCECISCDNLFDVYPSIKKYEIICIDEGAFFKEIVSFCEMLANNGHIVIVASLIGNYKRERFNDILNLIPKCEKVTMINAICVKCFNETASFSKRIVNSTELELIGGSESYIAVCRKCFFS